MTKPIIEIKGVSKCYRVGAKKEHYLSLRDEIAKRFSPSARKARSTLNDFWALRDVSFDIKQGEAVGIIGRNGAGKSTLLKVLSRITPPTEGQITLRGRVASLLEVGTGFHPELSGRENIFLNGAILGMSRKEIRSKFDEIVAFAEIERFLDTPVKRYSSGMYVRLAFAVAAHLEPEILLVDEVLAVGDVEFQRKCLGKMGEAAKSGRTVLFISHNMSAVSALCSRAVILKNGRLTGDGPVDEVIGDYLRDVRRSVDSPLAERTDRTGRGGIRFVDVSVSESSGIDPLSSEDDLVIRMRVVSNYAHTVKARLSISIRTISEVGLISCDSALKGETFDIAGMTETVLSCRLYSPPLNEGEYYLNTAIFDGGEAEDWVTSAARFTVSPKTFNGRVGNNAFPVISEFEWAVEEQVGIA